MAKAKDPPNGKRRERDEKLAQALRANLRRRKAAAAKPPVVAGKATPPNEP